MTWLLCALLCAAFYLDAPRAWAMYPHHFEPTSLWSSLLLHQDALHLWVNVLGILPAGLLFERNHGRLSFVAFCATTGALSSLGELTAQPEFVGAVLGASGLACALLGSFAATNRGTLLLSALLCGHLVHSAMVQTDAGIAYFAHLSGYLCGLIWSILAQKGASHGTQKSSLLPEVSS